MNVTIYTRPGYPQCEATMRRLREGRTAFTQLDVSTDPWALMELSDMGYTADAVPVVVAGDRRWSGYRPDLLDALA